MDFCRTTRVYWVVWAVVALIGALAVAGPASAQTPTASIVGTVLDPQGLPVEGANVTLTNQGTNYAYSTATNYSVPPIKLEVGSAKETITVEAGAEVVNTTDTEVASTVDKKQIEDLPILDRNPLNLLNLEAGVNNSRPNGPTTTTINGQRTTYTNMTLDGINIQDNFIREN